MYDAKQQVKVRAFALAVQSAACATFWSVEGFPRRALTDKLQFVFGRDRSLLWTEASSVPPNCHKLWRITRGVVSYYDRHPCGAQNAAVEAMTEACGVVGNRDVEPFVPTLIGAMLRPTEASEAIHKLGAVTFVQVRAMAGSAAAHVLRRCEVLGKQRSSFFERLK